MKIYLRIYQLPTPINRFVDLYQKLFCKWNHCAIQIDEIVFHFFDDYTLPKWVDHQVDDKKNKPVHILYIGEKDIDWQQIRLYTNSYGPITFWDKVVRYICPFTFYTINKPRDCVGKSSRLLNHLFGTPVCNGTPDMLYKEILKWKSEQTVS